MKTIFDPSVRDELIRRVNAVTAGSQRQWGKMSAPQMLEHLARNLEMATGRRQTPRLFVGRLISRFFKRDFVGEKPFRKNAPTGAEFIVHDEPVLEHARERVKTLIREVHVSGDKGCEGRVHAFFGPLTGVEWGISSYKHVDHHLRQFGV